MENKQFVYMTGHNCAGKTTLGQNFAEKFAAQGWHCIDGDEFAGEPLNPDLWEMLITISKSEIMDLMRGTLTAEWKTEEERYEEVKDADVKTCWEPYFRKVFERLKQHMSDKNLNKVVFPFHLYRSWMLDLVREYFGQDGCKCTIVEVTTDPKVRYQRWLDRQVTRGLEPAKRWQEDTGVPMTTLRNAYGPEYKGNEEHFLKFVEHRYFMPREKMPQDQADIVFIPNDNFDGLKELENILGPA